MKLVNRMIPLAILVGSVIAAQRHVDNERFETRRKLSEAERCLQGSGGWFYVDGTDCEALQDLPCPISRTPPDPGFDFHEPPSPNREVCHDQSNTMKRWGCKSSSHLFSNPYCTLVDGAPACEVYRLVERNQNGVIMWQWVSGGTDEGCGVHQDCSG
jgi:hypothetical protein